MGRARGGQGPRRARSSRRPTSSPSTTTTSSGSSPTGHASSRSRSRRTRPDRSQTRRASARSRATRGRSRGSTRCTTPRTSRSTSPRIGCDVLLCSPYKFCGPHLGIAFMRARARRHVAPVQGAAVEAAVRDGHAAVRAARRLQRDDRLPRHDRRDGADPQLRARARRAVPRGSPGERDAVRPADDGRSRADVPLQRRRGAGRRRRAPARRARLRRLVCGQLVLRRRSGRGSRSNRCAPGIAHYNTAEEVDGLAALALGTSHGLVRLVEPVRQEVDVLVPPGTGTCL